MTDEIDSRENKNRIKHRPENEYAEEEDSAVFIDPIEAVETVGTIPPVVLISGILIGLLLFVLIAGGLIAFILNGGLGLVADLPNESVAIKFDSSTNSAWQELKLTGENESGQLIYVREAFFVDGRYRMISRLPNQVFWSTAGIDFAFGDYAVDITFEPQSAEIERGAGLIFFVNGNEGQESFYLFEIDPDGFAWIGRCEAACEVAIPLTGNGWFLVDALKIGADETNRLKVTVRRSEMIFFVNDVEIGYVGNLDLSGWGDAGFLVELADEGEVVVDFDDFLWAPHEP